MTSDKVLELANIQQQFKQDLIVVYKNHVYVADCATMLMLDKFKEPVDKDGFPVSLSGDDLLHLSLKLSEARHVARQKFFKRMAASGIDKLTEVKSETEEPTE